MALEVRDVWYRYESGVEALRGMSLAVRAGERLAIVGQNGSGKTTLAKHFNGLLRPTQGTVLVEGRGRAPPLHRRAGHSRGLRLPEPGPPDLRRHGLG